MRVLLICATLFAGVTNPVLPNVGPLLIILKVIGHGLMDTFWYVTQENLQAVVTDLATQQHLLVSDQTVWRIEDYSKGTFGKPSYKLQGGNPLCLSMAGSITPEGDVQVTFTLPLPAFHPS
jgi:hypothetical protein